ncbi:MAG TPA: cytidine deaminase [Gemmatimonadaceae bacterium]|nr:cytidine deaminase [Gemmatimonadaceae bacterium]
MSAAKPRPASPVAAAPPGLDALRAAAGTAMTRAYAPYSRFRVGAALRASGGEIVAGCNVENSSFPSGGCAERGALFAAVVAGHRRFTHLTIVTEAEEPTPPCGMCRQALVEFGAALEISSFTTGGREAHWTLAELLPSPFTPQSLHHR